MHKLIIEIYLPAAGKSYDVRIPAGKRIGEITPLIEKGMAELMPEYFMANSESVLCDCVTGVILDINLTPLENGVLNGTKLMLI